MGLGVGRISIGPEESIQRPFAEIRALRTDLRPESDPAIM
jgi:hypothetical protein